MPDVDNDDLTAAACLLIFGSLGALKIARFI
jgi:hypothetical protein